MPTPKTKPVAKTPAAVPSRPLVTLEPFHEFLADVFTRLVVHGGPGEDDLLFALYTAKWQAIYSQAEINERWINKDARIWRKRFGAAKRALLQAEAKERVHKTLSDQVRANQRDYLAREFNYFLEKADPEEASFMTELLDHWSSNSISNRGEGGQIYLLNSFNELLDREQRFLRVPAWAADSMEQYLGWLTEQRDKLAEAA